MNSPEYMPMIQQPTTQKSVVPPSEPADPVPGSGMPPPVRRTSHANAGCSCRQDNAEFSGTPIGGPLPKPQRKHHTQEEIEADALAAAEAKAERAVEKKTKAKQAVT